MIPHTRGKWLSHGSKHHKDNQSQSLNKAWNTHAEYPLYSIYDPGKVSSYLSDGLKPLSDLMYIYNQQHYNSFLMDIENEIEIKRTISSVISEKRIISVTVCLAEILSWVLKL